MHSPSVPRLTERFVVHLLGAFICSGYWVTHEAMAEPAKVAWPSPAASADTVVAALASPGITLKLERMLPVATPLAIVDEREPTTDLLVTAAPPATVMPSPAMSRSSMFPELAKVAMADQVNIGPLVTLDREEMLLAAVESANKTRMHSKPAAPADDTDTPAAVVIAAAKPVPAAAPADVAPVTSTWEVRTADKTLNATLARWAATAGWQLVWELPVDYAVEVRSTIPGTLEEAVGMVAQSMDAASVPMKAIFYEGNKVLRIVAKGSE
jgi:hypothetical protein